MKFVYLNGTRKLKTVKHKSERTTIAFISCWTPVLTSRTVASLGRGRRVLFSPRDEKSVYFQVCVFSLYRQDFRTYAGGGGVLSNTLEKVALTRKRVAYFVFLSLPATNLWYYPYAVFLLLINDRVRNGHNKFIPDFHVPNFVKHLVCRYLWVLGVKIDSIMNKIQGLYLP